MLTQVFDAVAALRNQYLRGAGSQQGLSRALEGSPVAGSSAVYTKNCVCLPAFLIEAGDATCGDLGRDRHAGSTELTGALDTDRG